MLNEMIACSNKARDNYHCAVPPQLSEAFWHLLAHYFGSTPAAFTVLVLTTLSSIIFRHSVQLHIVGYLPMHQTADKVTL